MKLFEDTPLVLSAKRVCAHLQAAGYQAVFVGGCVRDALLGIPVKEIDIATDALPDTVMRVFPNASLVGKSFGVVIVTDHAENFHFEVATFRKERGSSDGRHPEEVSFGYTAMEDMPRRDFTINGMYYYLDYDKLIDIVGGKTDLLVDKTLRFIGNPEQRIGEDSLRMLRAARFAAKFDLSTESNALSAIQRHAQEVSELPAERLFQELCKGLLCGDPAHYLELLCLYNLIPYTLPVLQEMQSLAQEQEYHPEGNVLIHTILALRALPKDAPLALLWATLLHDVGKRETRTVDDYGKIHFYNHEQAGKKVSRQILLDLRAPGELMDTVSDMVGNHMRFRMVQKMGRAKLIRFLLRPTFEQDMELYRADCLASDGDLQDYYFMRFKQYALAQEIRELTEGPDRTVSPLVTGDDLIALGLKPGPAFGSILHEVEEKFLDGDLPDKEAALEYVKQNYKTEQGEKP